VSGFSAEWLSLREPADAMARSDALARYVARAAGHRGGFLDLGGGTGANVRYLWSRFPSPQHWTLVESDRALLARVPEGVTTVCADLNQIVDDNSLFRGCRLVTASALLDLVSDAWLHRLVGQCQSAAVAVLFALSYDGRIVCTPAEPEDEDVRRLVNAHQRTDKGFGPALGPDAGTRAVELLSAARYELRHERTDWMLDGEFPQLQRQLIDGWAQAASELAPHDAAALAGWRDRRIAHVNAGRSRIVVGHLDVAGIPTSNSR
jgi:hypothetical protein